MSCHSRRHQGERRRRRRLSIDASGDARRVRCRGRATCPAGPASTTRSMCATWRPTRSCWPAGPDGAEGAARPGGVRRPGDQPGRWIRGVRVARPPTSSPGTPAGVVETYVRDLRAADAPSSCRARAARTGRPPRAGAFPGRASSTAAGCVSFASEDALLGRGQRLLAGLPARAPRRTAGPACRTRVTPRRPWCPGRGSAARRFRVGRARTPLAAEAPAAAPCSASARARPARRRSPFPRTVRGRHGRRRLRRAGRLTRTIGAGPARIALSGRVGRRAMRAGRYRLTLQVRDAAGNLSRPVRLQVPGRSG